MEHLVVTSVKKSPSVYLLLRIVEHKVYLCKSDDCKAFVDHKSYLCRSANYTAIVENKSYLCK